MVYPVHSGELSKGCELCREGKKLVLFVSGRCNMACFYCPLSEDRRGDRSFANELEIREPEEAVEEARRMLAEGAGVTGGDPLLVPDRTLGYVEALKENLGREFHIHLYTAQPAGREILEALARAGVDEIRFHITEKNSRDIWDSIQEASEIFYDFGVEIPALPDREEEIMEIALRVNNLGGFLNINELEFSHTNYRALIQRGYELKSDESYAAKGSEITALKVLEFAREHSLRVHYCSASFKDGVQLRNRLLRTALNVAKDYEEVTEEGLLIKGVIVAEGDLLNLMEELKRKFDIPSNLIAYDVEKNRIETTVEIVETLSEIYRKPGLRYYIVEEYPTSDRLETEVVPL